MSTEEKNTGKPEKSPLNKQKRGIIIAFIAMLSVIVITYAVIPAVSKLADYIESQKEEYKSDYMDDIKSLSFHPANYNENIFEDEEYMSLNRDLSYTKGGDTYLITDGDYSGYDVTVGFFAEYFDSVINGEYETYDEYFTEEYFEECSNKERFTPQKLYDINVKLRESVDKDGVTVYVYYVKYKIFENNGTFRNDMESDCERVLVYELYADKNDNVLINYIGRTVPTYDE